MSIPRYSKKKKKKRLTKEFRFSFTFHLLLQGEASMDLFQFCLHGQPTNVGLQVGAVHHADAEHYECDVLWL